MIKRYARQRFALWLQRRMPPSKQITLHRGNVFIFPSKMGVQFLLCCFLLFLLATNYQNNLILLLVFFMCSFMVTTLLLTYRNVAQLTLQATSNEAQFAGQDCAFHLRLRYPKGRAEQIYYAFQDGNCALQSTLSSDNVTLYANGQQRGHFNPGRITLSSTFPFGLYRVWTHIDFDLQVLLYPAPIENEMNVQVMGENVAEEQHCGGLSGVDEFASLSPYKPGESLKSVAWKQLAQGRGWLSKQFEQATGKEVLLDIDTLRHLPLETRLSYLSYQIVTLEATHQGYALRLDDLFIALGRGSAHQQQCLAALALYRAQQ